MQHSLRKISYWLLYLWLTTAIVGCGFNLRGYNQLNSQLKTMYVRSNVPYGGILQQLQQTLRSLGIKLTQTPAEAPITLVILNDTKNQIVTSTNATTQLRTFLFVYNLSYQLLDKTGKPITPIRSISATRTFTANPNQVLGDSSEQLNVIQDLRRDVVYQLLNQLNTRSTKQALQKLNHEN